MNGFLLGLGVASLYFGISVGVPWASHLGAGCLGWVTGYCFLYLKALFFSPRASMRGMSIEDLRTLMKKQEEEQDEEKKSPKPPIGFGRPVA